MSPLLVGKIKKCLPKIKISFESKQDISFFIMLFQNIFWNRTEMKFRTALVNSRFWAEMRFNNMEKNIVFQLIHFSCNYSLQKELLEVFLFDQAKEELVIIHYQLGERIVCYCIVIDIVIGSGS